MLHYVKDRFIDEFSKLTPYSKIGEKFLYQHECRRYSLSRLLREKEFFIYPLFIGSNRFFLGPMPTLPDNVIQAVKNGYGAVVFFYLNEGNVCKDIQIKLLEGWSKEQGFTSKNVFFVHSNLLLENIKSKYITFKSFNFFEASIWHFQETNRNLPQSITNKINQINAIEHKHKEYYFNCLNRASRSPRIFLVSLLKAYKEIDSKCLLSLGNKNFKTNSYNLNDIPYNSSSITDENDLQQVKSFVDKEFHNIKENGITLDQPDLKKINTHKVNFNIYNNSYISIISETEYIPNVMFFTEKTFRSISIKQPFFLIGNRYSLDHLKSLGYRTFDRWWDESYDTLEDVYDRTYGAFKEIKKISKLDKNSLYCMIKEMEEVLNHNFYHFFNNSRYSEFFNFLKNINGSI